MVLILGGGILIYMARIGSVDNDKKLDYASSLMERKLSVFDSASESLNTKLASLLGFQGVIITLGAGLAINNDVDGLSLAFFSAGVFVMLVSVILVIKLMFTVEYIDPPYTGVLWSDESLRLSSQEYKNQMISDMVAAYNANVETLDERGKYFNKTLVIFGVGLVLIVASVISLRWSSNDGHGTQEAQQNFGQYCTQRCG